MIARSRSGYLEKGSKSEVQQDLNNSERPPLQSGQEHKRLEKGLIWQVRRFA